MKNISNRRRKRRFQGHSKFWLCHFYLQCNQFSLKRQVFQNTVSTVVAILAIYRICVVNGGDNSLFCHRRYVNILGLFCADLKQLLRNQRQQIWQTFDWNPIIWRPIAWRPSVGTHRDICFVFPVISINLSVLKCLLSQFCRINAPCACTYQC